MSSFVIDIKRLDKLRKKATFSEIKKLLCDVRNYSCTEDSGCIVGNKEYHIQMPNTVHSFFLTQEQWNFETKKAVFKRLRTGQNYIHFAYYESKEECKKDLIAYLTADNARMKMFIDRNNEAINNLKS